MEEKIFKDKKEIHDIDISEVAGKIHTFCCCGDYFVYDIESGALHQVDESVYIFLTQGKGKVDESTAREIEQELFALIEQGALCASQPENVPLTKSDLVKSLCLHISHDCNLRCTYCFASQGSYHGQRKNMSEQVGIDSIDFLIANSKGRKNLEVDFFGGEPLMNFEVVKKIVEYANEMGGQHGKKFLFTLTTNGLLLDKQTADYLNEKMENVVLSLDGRKQINDWTRKTANGKGSYDLIVDKFKYFKSIRKGSYYVRGTFTANNLDFCDDVLHINDLGFDQISVEPVVLPDDHDLCIRQEHLEKIGQQYEQLAKEYILRRKNKDKWFSFFHYVLDLENSPCYKKKIVGCGAGYEYLAVSPEGDIYPCHQFMGEEQWKMGNVSDGKLDRRIRDIFGQSNLTTKADCRGCWAKYHCSGGCSANAVHFNGDINKPYKLACQIFRKRLECALYVYAKEHN